MEQDVTKKGDLSGYYTHLLKDNVSMGGGPRDFATRQTQNKSTNTEPIKDEKAKDLYSLKKNNDQDNNNRERNERRDYQTKFKERREPNSPESKKA